MQNYSTPYRVLIVDDAASVREALRWALEAETDLEVVGEARDGIEAIHFTRELDPDAVLLDIELPYLDGYAVARSIKALPDPPLVIFLTVHGDLISRQQGVAAGSDGFVEKSAGWPVLLDQLRCLLPANPGFAR